jgi:hypothetical protein
MKEVSSDEEDDEPEYRPPKPAAKRASKAGGRKSAAGGGGGGRRSTAKEVSLKVPKACPVLELVGGQGSDWSDRLQVGRYEEMT